MFEFFEYGFIIRGLLAGLIVGATAPLVGIFLVLRRYSLIADTLSHVSLAGVAVGLLMKINPILTAIASTVLSSVFIEKIRLTKKIYGESALSIFLTGSLALAIVLISASRGFNVNLFNYLFGSILTVSVFDVGIIFCVGMLALSTIFLFYKELVFITFDEESARVSGIPTTQLNLLLIVLTAVIVSLSISIVGVLLISALIVIPVVTALQLRNGFKKTIIYAEIFSLTSVIFGVVVSFYFNLATGGTIVLFNLLFLAIVFLAKERKHVLFQ